jgi:hypothetical protein
MKRDNAGMVPTSLSGRQSWVSRSAIAAALLLGACGPDFDPRTKLSGYRVIGVQASPPEVTPDGTVELSAFDYNEGTEGTDEVTYRWSVCLFSIGAAVGFDCIDPAAEIDLGTAPTARLDLGPGGLNLRAALDELGTVPNPDGSPRTLEDGFDVLVRLTSGPDCEGCDRIETVKRVTVRESDALANANPTISSFEVEGPTQFGAKVKLRVQTNDPEPYVELATGEAQTEEYLYTWYTTRGETDPGLTFGEDQETDLGLIETGPVRVFVAVRDGRGGLAVASQQIEVTGL